MADSSRPVRPVLRGARRDPRLAALAEDSGYEIRERIGAGGMGIVYRAVDADGRDVAVKLLRHEIADDPRARQRLAREVAAQRILRDEGVVRVLDAELESPDAFVVTEFVPGPTLEDAVRSHSGLHPEAVRELGLVLGGTLQAIHGAGVVHRDLKPSNVLLRGAEDEELDDFDPEGPRLEPVIIDFGIAMAAEESRLTSTGLVMGTAAYLDPEVVRTNHSGEAGDWWSWAAMLAFAVTGREPFGSGRADVVFLRADRGEIDLDGVPYQFAQWLRSALRPEPSDRPDPADLLSRLEELDLTADAPEEAEGAPGGGGGAVLPAAAAGAAAASGQADGSGADAGEDRTEALPRIEDDGAQDGRTTAIPADGEGRTEALPADDSGRTEAFAAGEDRTEAFAAGEGRTEAFPAGEGRTEALPAYTDADRGEAEPRTEMIPAYQETPTSVMPPVSDDPYAGSPDGGYAGAGFPAAQPAPAPYGPGGAPYGAGAMTVPPAPGAQPMPYGWVPPAPRRPVLATIGHLIVIALAGVAPYFSLAVLLLLGALSRAWETSHRSLLSKQQRGKAGRGSQVATGIAWPFRFLLGVLVTVLQVIFPLLLGVLVAVAIDVILWLAGAEVPDGILLAVAMAITVLLTWVGLGSRTTRQGAHRMLDAASPDTLWSAVVGGLMVLLLAAVVVAYLARGGTPDYFPFPQGPTFDDLAFWRRTGG